MSFTPQLWAMERPSQIPVVLASTFLGYKSGERNVSLLGKLLVPFCCQPRAVIHPQEWHWLRGGWSATVSLQARTGGSEVAL